MFRRALTIVAAAAILGSAACAPIASHNGFQAIESDPKDIKVGVDTKSTVRGKLGSPSGASTFDPNVWFYMSQVKHRVAFRRPRVVERNVTLVSFNKETEQVMAVNNYTLKDGKVVAFNGRETPTRGRELTILEQILGNVGATGMLPNNPQDSGVPGSRPGDRR
ncbi:outer membrane protein assembly factor BamE [Phenylobacterium immobile]|uniref:outer membrane protein assembly factor BamE n=1 Tax=Phenylobacterium immobile TaxID=21 RepID=UPI000AE00FDF|nr:outer membrane protein assembly factor BamE [Phenylobacterium immobile]